MTDSVGVSLDALLHAARAARAIRPDVPLALATLVDVEGSSFRQPGARLLVDAECRCLAGAISGGCLEADVASRAKAVCASGVADYLVYDLRDDLQAIWGFDAACDGVAHILLEPLHDTAWLEAAVELRRARKRGSVLTLVKVEPIMNGSDQPSRAVDHMSEGIDRTQRIGVAAGTVGASLPGAIAANEGTVSLLHTVGETQRASLGTITIDDASIRLFADPLLPPVALHVIGAGRGAEAFARIGASIGWQVTIVDHRPALLESLSLPAGVTCRHARPEQASELVADAFSAVALMTHIFDIDRRWLEALLPRNHGYIGVLGSRQRAERLLGAIEPMAKTPLHAPIGLDIGGESPESIALATIAEIHAVMHARPGGPLRERRSPIHDRTPVPVANAEAIRAACRLPE